MRKLLFLGAISLTMVACYSQSFFTQGTSSVRTASELYEAFQGNVLELLNCARQSNRVVVVAHRGGFAPGYPENSIHSVRQINEKIPAVVEIDVVSSGDGRDFLHHDKSLDRTTTGSGPVDALSWEQISRLQLRDNSGVVTDFTPDLLDQVLIELQGKAFLMLDLKSPADTATIVEKLASADMLNSTVLIAYNVDQYLEITNKSADAVVALGANNEEQVEFLEHMSGGTPIVALTGEIGRGRELYSRIRKFGHYALVGTYNGNDPVDRRLATGNSIGLLDRAASNDIQMVVSDRPIDAYRYLDTRNLAADPSLCR